MAELGVLKGRPDLNQCYIFFTMLTDQRVRETAYPGDFSPLSAKAQPLRAAAANLQPPLARVPSPSLSPAAAIALPQANVSSWAYSTPLWGFLLLLVAAAVAVHFLTAGTAQRWLVRSLVGFVAFGASLGTCWLVVRTAHKPGRRWLDDQLAGPQKFHLDPVPRIGGAGVVVGLGAACAVLAWYQTPSANTAALLLACSAPAFLIGLLEDLTKRISPKWRLAGTALSGALAVWQLGIWIAPLDAPGVGWLFGFAPLAMLFTVFSVCGIANAINIIDGFNGLASLCVMLMLAGLAGVGFQVRDTQVIVLALAGLGATLGFFALNYPHGRIFLGDGGAYLLGFYVAEISILLLHRNPQVSPLCVLLMAAYPVVETLYSIYRRFRRARPASMADGMHLHSLIYRRMLGCIDVGRGGKSLKLRNARTAPYLWVLCLLPVVTATLAWNRSLLLAGLLVLFVVLYAWLYGQIVAFKSRRWLRHRQQYSQAQRPERAAGPKEPWAG